ncbi:MAG: cytochrome C [Blastocatellia bacterium]
MANSKLKRAFTIASIGLAAAFLAAQFIQPSFSNPPINESETFEAVTNVPPTVAAIIERSCADCHTNRTTYPWYSRISPVSWYLHNHIDEGRRKLNFSVWATYSAKKKSKKLEEICEQVQGQEMPLPSYLFLHRDAVLSKADVDMLCTWVAAERQRLETSEN